LGVDVAFSLPGFVASLAARRGADVAAAVVLAGVATLIAYPRGLHFPFALDDYTYLMPAAGLEPAVTGIRRWLAIRGWYEAGLRLFGPAPFGWHVLAYALHAGNAAWVYVLARRFAASRPQGWIASTLFAASAVAFTVLYWIACIQEIGSTFLVLASAYVIGFTRRPWWSVPLFTAAVLFKESVLLAPLCFVVLFGKRVFRIAAVQLASGAALFIAAGLHGRMFDARPDSPYATAYDFTVLQNFATQLVWTLAPWRAYPDRLASPQPQLVLPALLVVALLLVGAAIARRSAVRAVAWSLFCFGALLGPVLPLRSHSYAYYSYLPQIGLWMLLAAVIAAIGRALARRLQRSTAVVVAILGAVAVAGMITGAQRNARTHETLMLPNSEIPHDSVVRSGTVAGSILRAMRDAELPPEVDRVTVISLPMDVAKVAQTPGQLQPGMVRQRSNPIAMAMRDGKFFRLHFGAVDGNYRDTLSVADELPSTALFFVAGLADLTRLPDAAEAYAIQAQGNLLGERRTAARRDLENALRVRPHHAVSRVLLAGMEAEEARLERAATLIDGVQPDAIPPQLRPYLATIRSLVDGTTPPQPSPAPP
jgi:hypothetical protein